MSSSLVYQNQDKHNHFLFSKTFTFWNTIVYTEKLLRDIKAKNLKACKRAQEWMGSRPSSTAVLRVQSTGFAKQGIQVVHSWARAGLGCRLSNSWSFAGCWRTLSSWAVYRINHVITTLLPLFSVPKTLQSCVTLSPGQLPLGENANSNHV